MLSAHLDGGGHVEDGVFATTLGGGLLDEVGDLLRLLCLYIAVKQEGCVVLIIVSERIEVGLVSLRGGGVDEVLKVGNQVRQLRHLDVTLDHITRVQVPYGLNELFESIIILLLLIKVVCMLLGYFGDDFPREISGSRDVLSLREEPLL